ncbi:MAG: hypothetical protein ACE5KO_04810, partial [Candidatus Bathyarchaeia archaeon]
QVYFTQLREIKNYRDYFSCDVEKFRRFHKLMLKRGVLFHPGQMEHMFVSTAHSDQDIDNIEKAAMEALKALT